MIVQELTTQLKMFKQEGFVGWLLKVICIFDRRHHLTVKSPLICKQPRVCLDRRDFEGKPSSPVLQKSITLSLVSNNPFKINQICEPASQLHDATVSSRDFSRKCLNLEEKQNIMEFWTQMTKVDLALTTPLDLQVLNKRSLPCGREGHGCGRWQRS